MNTRIIALACAVSAAAFSADASSAQELATSSADAAPFGGSTNVAPATDSDAAVRNSTVVGTTTTATGKEVADAPRKLPPHGNTPNVVNNAGVADHTKNADNTKINERDRHDTLTPMSQGNSGAETTITATIRKKIVGDKALSFAGKNVKVITVGSKVTLRGPVKSDQAKADIEALATNTAGVSEVDNQLEVKK